MGFRGVSVWPRRVRACPSSSQLTNSSQLSVSPGWFKLYVLGTHADTAWPVHICLVGTHAPGAP
jgi:hypothetical protein